MINKVILIGNLGRDPEIRVLESGAKVANFTVATNENYRDKSGVWQQNTEWHNVVAWTFLADRAESQLKKGSFVYVEGKLTHRKYTDKENIDRYITEVRAIVLRSLESRSGGEDSGERASSHGMENRGDAFSKDLTEDIDSQGTEEEDPLPF